MYSADAELGAGLGVSSASVEWEIADLKEGRS